MANNYFNSIDTCSILLFVLISKGKKDATALCIDGKPNEGEAAKAWDELYTEYLEEFGVSAEYKHYIRQKIQLCEMIEGYYVNGETWRKILITIKKHEIAQLEAQMTGTDSDFTVTVGRLSKKMGFGIDPSKTSIRQFYSYIKS